MAPFISDAYLAEQRKLHAAARYGVASSAYAPMVRALLHLGKCASLSDYGAGKCNLGRALGKTAERLVYLPFDPAFPEYGQPQPADLVACIDVLEHVEPGLLDSCLDEIAALTTRFVLLTVHTGPAKKRLSDGRNAHLIQRPLAWWLPRFGKRFDLIHFQAARNGFYVLACPMGKYARLDAEFDLVALSHAVAAVAPPAAKRLRTVKSKLNRSLRTGKYEAGTLWLAARHPDTPWLAKIVAGAAALCALSPIDLTPDFIPVFGYFDDLLLMLLATLLAKRLIPPGLLAELRRRAATIDYAQAMRGAAAMGALWVGATVVAFAHHWRLVI